MTTKLSDEEIGKISSNLRKIEETIEKTKACCGVKGKISVCAATKTVTPERIQAARECGLGLAGENRVQELTDKYSLGAYEGLGLHFIGRLQQNKVKYLVGKVSLIQSLDSLSLAAEIEKRYGAAGLVCDVLAEINSGEEPEKGGILPEEAKEFIWRVSEFPHLRIRGLMTVGPICEKRTDIIPFFEKTYKLFSDIGPKTGENVRMEILSMGMSGNYDIAVSCGATMVRPGSAIFGLRDYGTVK